MVAGTAMSVHLDVGNVRFDARIYQLTTLKKAAYRFLKEFVTEITQDDDEWACILHFPAPMPAQDIECAVRNLQAEVLDQDLRATVARESEHVRNAVLALAFSRTGLQGSE
jgi:His-Xaa-Ser system protein HxsD